MASSGAGSSGGIDAGYTGAAMSGRSTSPMGGGMKEGTSRLASSARQYADDVASKAKEKSRTVFDQQKETAVGQVSQVASAIRSTAGQLQGEGQDQVARYVGMLADQLENLGGRLREKDLDTLLDDAQNLARRSPGTFFVGSVAVGFLLARFLKSSSTSGVEYRGYSGEQDEAWRSAAATSSGAYMGSTTGAAGTTGTTGTAGTTGAAGVTGGAGSVGSGGSASRGVGADGTPGTSGTTIGSSATPLNGSGAGGPSI
ncbi:hypothetical protein NCCP691_04040 [Noviherbaspirillum aridicola]|uniref:Nutrient deprivation-induced protein n=2 Tax=Noviherbaspirillum aridicola TaxID=2849687 RepID=A0ABQ4PZY1_9BURK|nr:hypothetical protein NCCP691_04040 [Noviherbaspirillum aridicola]